MEKIDISNTQITFPRTKRHVKRWNQKIQTRTLIQLKHIGIYFKCKHVKTNQELTTLDQNKQ